MHEDGLDREDEATSGVMSKSDEAALLAIETEVNGDFSEAVNTPDDSEGHSDCFSFGASSSFGECD